MGVGRGEDCVDETQRFIDAALDITEADNKTADDDGGLTDAEILRQSTLDENCLPPNIPPAPPSVVVEDSTLHVASPSPIPSKAPSSPSSLDTIKDVKFKTYGCGSAIASSTMFVDMLKGLTIDEAKKIEDKQIAEALQLPPIKLHCSVLAEEAIGKAIEDWENKKSVEAALFQPVT